MTVCLRVGGKLSEHLLRENSHRFPSVQKNLMSPAGLKSHIHAVRVKRINKKKALISKSNSYHPAHICLYPALICMYVEMYVCM